MDDRRIENHMVLPYADDETAERYLSDDDGGLSYRPYLYSDCQKAEALDEVFDGEWRGRYHDPAIAFFEFDCDRLREVAEEIRERDRATSRRYELRGALEDIARMSDIALLRKQAG